jgi:hypothetical protein
LITFEAQQNGERFTLLLEAISYFVELNAAKPMQQTVYTEYEMVSHVRLLRIQAGRRARGD